MRLVPIDEIEAQKAADKERYAPPPDADTLLGGIERHIENCWQAALRYHRTQIEPRLFSCLRRRKGEYEGQKLAEIQKLRGAELYLKHTGMKCRAAKSWIKDVIIPAGQKPWGIEPTPVPDLPEELRAQIIQKRVQEAMQQFAMSGQIPDMQAVTQMIAEEHERLEAAIRDEAERRARAMQAKIEDQLTEGNYADELDSFIDDLVTYPIAILRGPVLRRKKSLKWRANFQPEMTDEIGHYDQRISPFDFFPSPGCKDVNDGYICIRDRFTRRELNSLKDVAGYSRSAIEAVLNQMQEGTIERLNTGNEPERARLESKDTHLNYQTGTSDDRVDGVWFYGSVQGIDLVTWGMNPAEIPDLTQEYDIEAIKIGNHVVRAVLNPDPIGRRPLYTTAYEKQSGSIYGEAIPEIMAPIQDAMNAVIRALVDNVGFASAQQVIVNMSRLHPASAKHAASMWPRKIWFTKDEGFGSQSSPIDFTQPQLIAQHLIRVLDKLERYADDHTGIPAYVYGNEKVGGAGETASGLNMLMNAASKGIRQVIGQVGRDVVKPRIERQYVWNMLFLDDPNIKGDCKVNARGTLAEIMRDSLLQKRQQFASQVLTPEIIFGTIGYRGVAKLLRGIVEEDLDMPGVVPRDEEVEQQMAMQQAQAQQAESSENAGGEK
ncbi:MAG: hypothetical protein JW713_05815 [Pontiellaceae bacterium]|nr:hypothetical protein [Pontiellaceae bacterium]